MVHSIADKQTDFGYISFTRLSDLGDGGWGSVTIDSQ